MLETFFGEQDHEWKNIVVVDKSNVESYIH